MRATQNTASTRERELRATLHDAVRRYEQALAKERGAAAEVGGWGWCWGWYFKNKRGGVVADGLG